MFDMQALATKSIRGNGKAPFCNLRQRPAIQVFAATRNVPKAHGSRTKSNRSADSVDQQGVTL
jgi:hypothetical protein